MRYKNCGDNNNVSIYSRFGDVLVCNVKIDGGVNDEGVNASSFLEESVSVFIEFEVDSLTNLINSLTSISFINKNDLEDAIILSVFFLIMRWWEVLIRVIKIKSDKTLFFS